MNANYVNLQQVTSSLGFAQRQLNRFTVEEEALHQPRIIMGKSFHGGGHGAITGDHNFNRSISNGGGVSNMSKTFGTSQYARSPINTAANNLPPQPRMLKIKSLKPINGSKIDNGEGLSLGESLRQSRVLREHIEKERAENLYSELKNSNQEGMSQMMRIRPSTPRLNLLKMKKQHQLPLQPQQQLPPHLETQNLRRRKPNKLAQLEPLQKLPALPQLEIPIIEGKEKGKAKKKKKNVVQSPTQIESSPEKLSPKYEEESPIFDRDTEDINFYEEPKGDENSEEYEDLVPGGGGLISNFQEKFEEIIQNEEVSDAIELNEKFLAEHLGVEANELAKLTKIELRVDTSCHNLQVTGEILSSLQYLRMSDSIIKCFRDIGTSFRFVRVLHLARCELKEVQGIQAFLNLEELYISYNDIDDLFDIGFLDHLKILDLEGNSVKNIDQLYYLKRCRSLTEVTLRYNPVASDPQYFKKITESVPSLEYLDDRVLMDYIPSSNDKKVSQIENVIAGSNLIQRLIKVTNWKDVSQFTKNLQFIDQDEDDLVIMVNNIKSYCPEKKALRQFFDNMLEELETNQLFRRTTFSQSFKNLSAGKSRPSSGILKNTASGTSFYKASTRKSTAMTNENDGGVCNQSDEKTQNSDSKQQSGKKKGVLTISRSRIKPAVGASSQQQTDKSSDRIPQDIFSLINDVDNQLQKNKDVIREKLTQNSSQVSFYSGNGESIFSKSVSRIKIKNPYSDEQQQVGGLASSAGGINKIMTRGSAGFKATGPMRIVIRPQDIQFTKTFKNTKDTD